MSSAAAPAQRVPLDAALDQDGQRDGQPVSAVADNATPARPNPAAWLVGLADALQQTACRHDGQAVSLAAGLAALADLWRRQRDKGARVYWIGNGGSAALVSHLSQDLLNKCGVQSTTFNDPALLTCMANDYGYRDVFRRPLLALAKPGDLLVAVSSSGNSENIVSAAESALDHGLVTVTLSGFDPANALHALPTSLAFHVPVSSYGQAEVAHTALLHAALDALASETQT